MTDNEAAYEAFERHFASILKQLSPQEMGKVLRRTYDTVAAQAVEIPRRMFRGHFRVLGDKNDFAEAVRVYQYTRGGGFLLTVQPRLSSQKGGEKGMHKNRYYYCSDIRKLPIVKWLEEGTEERKTKGFVRKRHSTGRIMAVNILKHTEPVVVNVVKNALAREMEKAVAEIASQNK